MPKQLSRLPVSLKSRDYLLLSSDWIRYDLAKQSVCRDVFVRPFSIFAGSVLTFTLSPSIAVYQVYKNEPEKSRTCILVDKILFYEIVSASSQIRRAEFFAIYFLCASCMRLCKAVFSAKANAFFISWGYSCADTAMPF